MSSTKGPLFLVLLAVQFGLQPLIAKQCTAPDAIKSVVVLSTEGVKIVLAGVMLLFEGPEARAAMFDAWTLLDSLAYAALPAAMYALQVHRKRICEVSVRNSFLMQRARGKWDLRSVEEHRPTSGSVWRTAFPCTTPDH